MIPFTAQSYDELRATLLTCDGHGKQIKEAALMELIRRAIIEQHKADEALRDFTGH